MTCPVGIQTKLSDELHEAENSAQKLAAIGAHQEAAFWEGRASGLKDALAHLHSEAA